MNRRLLIASFCLISLAVAAALAQQESLPTGPDGAAAAAPPKTDQRHYSYAIGLDMGASFGRDKIDLDLDELLAGLRDGLAAAKPKYPLELCGVAMQRLSEQRLAVLLDRNRQFLAKNAKLPGVQITKSGLQYIVLAEGKGASPGPQDVVQVHYRGQMIDGTVFDETSGRKPAEFPVGRVIPGWTEALQKMKIGSKWRVTIPGDLAYGAEGRLDAGIPPHSILIFDMELLGVQGK